MKVMALAVYDEKAEAYLPPYFVPAAGVGIRAFEDALQDPSTNVGKHPEDYKLYRVGWFDDADGVLQPEQPPVLLAHKQPTKEVLRSVK